MNRIKLLIHQVRSPDCFPHPLPVARSLVHPRPIVTLSFPNTPIHFGSSFLRRHTLRDPKIFMSDEVIAEEQGRLIFKDNRAFVQNISSVHKLQGLSGILFGQ